MVSYREICFELLLRRLLNLSTICLVIHTYTYYLLD